MEDVLHRGGATGSTTVSQVNHKNNINNNKIFMTVFLFSYYVDQLFLFGSFNFPSFAFSFFFAEKKCGLYINISILMPNLLVYPRVFFVTITTQFSILDRLRSFYIFTS